MSDIVWEDPPESKFGPHRALDPILAECKKHPGKWAIFRVTSSPSIVTRVRDGKYALTQPGEFEATSRKRTDGTYHVYVRYVGAES